MTLSDYVKKKNGVPFSHPQSLRNNLYRSLGARNFATFWTFWNPIFSYYLGTRVFKPLKHFLPDSVSLVITFFVCGAIHDLVTAVVRGGASFFFSVWFLLMALVVLATKYIRYDLYNAAWIIRVLVNLTIISVCCYITYILVG